MTIPTDCCPPIPEFLLISTEKGGGQMRDSQAVGEPGPGTTEKNDSELQLDSLELHINNSYQQMPVDAREMRGASGVEVDAEAKR
jgi:hypothetical protein